MLKLVVHKVSLRLLKVKGTEVAEMWYMQTVRGYILLNRRGDEDKITKLEKYLFYHTI